MASHPDAADRRSRPVRDGRSTSAERLDVAAADDPARGGLVVILVALLLGFIGWNGIQIFTASHYGLGDIFSHDVVALGGSGSGSASCRSSLGTLGVMAVAAVISTPLSVGLAIFMAEVAPDWARNITRPAMEVFVGIPSVVYGFLGLTILVPFLRENFRGLGFTLGFSWFAGSLVLALMILPTITAIAYDALIVGPAGPPVRVARARDDALADDPPHPDPDRAERASLTAVDPRDDAGRR